MDALARSRRLLLIALAPAIGAAAVACERPAESPVGVSSALPPHGTPRSLGADGGASPSKRELAILPRDFRARYAKLSPARFVSLHGTVNVFEAELYANDAAKGSFARQTGTFPQGAVLVQEHWDRTATTPEGAPQPSSIMAMEKMAPGFDPEHGDWRYVVVDAQGDVLTDGKPDGCVLCHDDAPHDHVFVLH